MFKIEDRVKYVGKFWMTMKYCPGTIKSSIYPLSDVEEDLMIDVLFDGENNTRRTYVKSLEKI